MLTQNRWIFQLYYILIFRSAPEANKQCILHQEGNPRVHCWLKTQSHGTRFLPKPLFWCLSLRTLAQIADVVQRKEEAVPCGSEPCESERCVVLLEGQLGQLGGACP